MYHIGEHRGRRHALDDDGERESQRRTEQQAPVRATICRVVGDIVVRTEVASTWTFMSTARHCDRGPLACGPRVFSNRGPRRQTLPKGIVFLRGL
jgi:hypothetical protein